MSEQELNPQAIANDNVNDNANDSAKANDSKVGDTESKVGDTESKVGDTEKDAPSQAQKDHDTKVEEPARKKADGHKDKKGRAKKVKDKMPLKERYNGIIETFLKEMPSPETELDYRNPYELLVAVVLSAQCTDKRINIVTPPLFEKYPNATELAKASFDDIHEFIKSVTFPNNKTKALMGLAKTLVEKYGGEVPSDIDSLLTLPGVGRKSANVILNVIYGKAVMPVDTHVFRVSERLGLTTKSPNPGATEKVLMKNIPEEHIQQAHHWLILHGRYVCKARKPECQECYLKKYCRLFKEEGENMMAQALKKDAKKDTKTKDSKKESKEKEPKAANAKDTKTTDSNKEHKKEASKKEAKPNAKAAVKESKPKKASSEYEVKAGQG